MARASWRRSLIVLAALALWATLAAAPAHASFDYLTKWGGSGSADGEFKEPTGVAIDADGNVYVADYGNDRIQKFSAGGEFLTKWGSEGQGDGQLDGPAGVATDADGNVYVADRRNNRIQKFSAAGEFLTKWGSFGERDGQFDFPAGIATDADGNVYVADSFNQRVQKFTAGGVFLTNWGGPGPSDGKFILPSGVATDADGNVYVADSFDHRVQKLSAAGDFLTKWGGQGPGDGELDLPNGLATDADGNVYVADTNNNRIQKFNAGGGFLFKFGSVGSDNGQFLSPSGVATDCRGNVYVADTGNDRVQKFGDSSAAPPPCTLPPPSLPLPEPQPQPQCSDAADNDLDGRLDWPADPGCSSPTGGDQTDAPGGCQLTAPRAGRALSAARLSRAARVLFEGPKGALVNRVARKRFRLRVGVYGDSRTRAVKRVAFLLDGKRVRARVIRRRVRGIPVWYIDLKPAVVPAGMHTATAEVTPRRGKPRRLKLRLRAVDCPPATFSAKIGTRGHGRKPVNLRLRVGSNGPPLATVKIALPTAALARSPRRPSTRRLGVLVMKTAGRRVRYSLSLPRNRTGRLTLARKGSVRVSLRQGRRPLLLIAGLPDQTVSADVRLLAARARLIMIANPCAAHKFKATLTGRPTGKVAVISPTAARRCD